MPDCTADFSAEFAAEFATEFTAAPPPTASHPAWQARLALGFRDDSGTTRLVRREHSGPLRVQKPLYPESPAVCHAIVVHPPGGVVGGDQLEIDAHVHTGAHAFLTTPGAGKWYRANGRISRQRVRLRADAGAAVEWLPQETIFFDDVHVDLTHHVTLAADASYLGCEILCLGRRASGEIFGRGQVHQQTSVRRGGKLLWWEQGTLTPATLASPLGLAGHTVCATLLAVGAVLPAAVVTTLRALGSEQQFGVTQMKHVLAVRWLGHDSEAARERMLAAWAIVRPALLNQPPFDPRSWRT